MFNRRLFVVMLLTALLASMLLMTSGCIRSRSNVQTQGRYIGDQTVARIEPGKTTREWVLAVMEEPTSKSRLESGVEIWKWSYQRVKTSSGSVLFLVAGSGRDETIRNVYVEFEGDIVRQVWRD
ncbi:MAG: hypothetical protein EA376_13090 [Phycisphaeraceae bacterium]|nr:MAG: hypothetical protein EA376_13090 [Phycisphaeraceae bacterium]